MNRSAWTVLSLILATCLDVAAQPAPSLHMTATNSVFDEFNAILIGTCPSGETVPYVTGEVVQVYFADNGILPPNTNGTPHVANPVYYAISSDDGFTRIGEKTSCTGKTGRFVTSLPRIYGMTNRIFVRVFDAPTIADAAFYGDSLSHTMQQTNSFFFPEGLTSTILPIDPNDSDGDGLNNSWEKSYNSNANMQDTDGDGVNDWAEAQAGTGLTDGDSYLELVELVPQTGNDAELFWDSVTGKCYQAEFTTDALTETAITYSTVGPIVSATGSVAHVTIPGALLYSNAHYRVRLATCP